MPKIISHQFQGTALRSIGIVTAMQTACQVLSRLALSSRVDMATRSADARAQAQMLGSPAKRVRTSRRRRPSWSTAQRAFNQKPATSAKACAHSGRPPRDRSLGGTGRQQLSDPFKQFHRVNGLLQHSGNVELTKTRKRKANAVVPLQIAGMRMTSMQRRAVPFQGLQGFPGKRF